MEVVEHVIYNLRPTLKQLVINHQILNTKKSDIFKMIISLIQTLTEKNIYNSIEQLYKQFTQYPETEYLQNVRMQVKYIHFMIQKQVKQITNDTLQKQCNELFDEIKNALFKIIQNTSDTKVFIYHQDAMALISEKQFQYIIKNYEQFTQKQYVMDYKTLVIFILLHVQLNNKQQDMIDYYKGINYQQDQIDQLIQRNNHLNIMENNKLLDYFKHTLAAKIATIVHNNYINNYIIKLYNMCLYNFHNAQIQNTTLKLLNLLSWNSIPYQNDNDIVNFLLFSNILQLKSNRYDDNGNDITLIQKIAELTAYINNNKCLSQEYLNMLLKNEWDFFQFYYPLNNSVIPTILYKIPCNNIETIEQLIEILRDQFVNQNSNGAISPDKTYELYEPVYIFEPSYSFICFFIQYFDPRISKKHQQLISQHIRSEVNYQLFIQHKEHSNSKLNSPILPTQEYYRAFYKVDCLNNAIIKDKNLIFAKLLINLIITQMPSHTQIANLYQLLTSLADRQYLHQELTLQLKVAFLRVINYKVGFPQLQQLLAKFYTQVYQSKSGRAVMLDVISSVSLMDSSPEKLAFSVLSMDYKKLYGKKAILEDACRNEVSAQSRKIIETLSKTTMYVLHISFYQLQLMISILNNPASRQYKALLQQEIDAM